MRAVDRDRPRALSVRVGESAIAVATNASAASDPTSIPVQPLRALIAAPGGRGGEADAAVHDDDCQHPRAEEEGESGAYGGVGPREAGRSRDGDRARDVGVGSAGAGSRIGIASAIEARTSIVAIAAPVLLRPSPVDPRSIDRSPDRPNNHDSDKGTSSGHPASARHTCGLPAWRSQWSSMRASPL